MESKKKVRFNGMDLFLIIAIVAIIGAGAFFLLGRGGTSTQEKNVTVTYTVELNGREENILDCIKEGDIVMVGEKDKAKMTVASVEIVPATTNGYDIETGKVLNSEIPGEYDIRVTMTATGTESEAAVKVDGVDFKVGRMAVLSSKGWAGSGYGIGLEAE